MLVRVRVNVCDKHNMDPEEDAAAANVNKTPAEIPCLQHEASRECTHPDRVVVLLSNRDDSVAQPLTDRSETLPLLDFQDSQLSPALALLPCLDKSHPLSDSTFFQHTDIEFVPLRGFPDLSVISERCPRLSHVGAADNSHLQETNQDHTTLSQHPLEVHTALSEEESSCCSLSQHSLSPGDHYKGIKEQSNVSCEAENKIDRHMEGEEQSVSQRLAGMSTVNSSSADASETAIDQPNTVKSHLEPPLNVQTDILPTPGTAIEKQLQSSTREQPQGSLSSSFQRTSGLAVSNITIRDSRMRSHQTVDHLCDQRGSVSEPGSRHNSGNKSSHSGLYVTPAKAGGKHMPGLQRVIWSLGNLTAADGSFLSSHPVSQSTPAVPLMRPPQALTKLSLVHSQEETLASTAASSQNSHSKTGLIPSLDLSVVDQRSSPTCPQTTVTVPTEPSLGSQTTQMASQAKGPPPPDTTSSDSQMKDQVSHLALGRVQSLPSLSYLQKVDAWTANQSSSRSFYDNLSGLTTLKGFDGVSHKNKSQEAVSGALHHRLSQDVRQPRLTQAPLSSSLSGSGSPRRVDVHRRQTSESPVNHSQSHSSLSSVLTSIQKDTGPQNQQVPVAQTDDIIPAGRSLSDQSSLNLSRRSEVENKGLAASTDKSSVKPSPLASLGRFSDVSSSFNMSSTLSSSQGSCHGEQSMRASVGAASSVVSLEVDNYAPYWASRPASPPQSRELNIEDRIPLYLQNLGIDQSPSTILNPFTRRGPIREPEFSPTDLCTIKGSIGTPTKSTQLSEADSPQKETFSSSSQLSADSNVSITQRLSAQGQPTVKQSVRTILSQPDTPPGLHSTLHPPDTPRSEGSCGISSQLSPDSIAAPVSREEVKDEDSFVGSGTLHEIRRLLGRAENLVSGPSSLTSSPGSHRLSESNTSLVSLGRNTSLSASGNFSLLLTRSSSDSALKGSLSSSQVGHDLSTLTKQPDALSLSRDESLKSRDLCVTPRRAEPEGCSAADPDKAKQSTALSAMKKNASLMAGNLSQNQKTDSAMVSSSESSPSCGSAEAGSLSDSISESSLAARVAKLLQSESPVSMVTSRPSTADPEESRAREWIIMKLSGRQCESLELNVEDRKRIEDIKRELLLNTQHTKWSSDSDRSAQSSIRSGSEPGKGFVGEHCMDSHISDVLEKASQKPLDSDVLHYASIQQDLETKVHQIALREGFSLPSLTSISIATTRHTPSPQLPSDIAGTMELGNAGDGYEHNGDHNGTDTNTLQRHQESIFPNVSERDEQMEGKGKPREKKEEADDNQKNAVKNGSHVVQGMSHMDHIVTDRNQILSSAASDTETKSDNESHLSHVHVTLSPRPKHQFQSVKYHSTTLSNQNSFKDVPPPRHSPIMSSTTTEQQQFNSVSNQARLFEHKEPVQGQDEGSVNSHLQPRLPQDFTPTQWLSGTSRTLAVQASAVPTLLPYKPHGSSELFYVAQADPEISPDCSDTTVESSHPGSDDAVPPHFNKDILGSREVKDHAIMLKHKEGIYSKRTSVKRDSSILSRRGFPESVVISTGQYNSTAPEASDEKFMDDEDHFVPLHMETDYSIDDLHLHSKTMHEPKLPLEPQHLPSQPIKKSSVTKNKPGRRPHDVSEEINSSLDQLWRRFNEKWSMEETRPINEGDTSLLDRLERLSRLIHNTTPTGNAENKQPDSKINRGRKIRSNEEARTSTKEGDRRAGTQLEVAPRQAWAEQEENPENVQRCPAERDESSGSSLSTIDTERLLRAFGPHRVESKGLRSSDGLVRLYNSINKQKPGRRKPSTKHAAVSVATDNVSTDDSTASPDYLSSSTTVSIPFQRGVATKRSKVKLLSKSVQAGDLEIVMNGTRRNTRDVGTIFPSPGPSINTRTSNTLIRDVQGVPVPTASTANPIQTLSALKRDSSNKSIRTCYPNGVSWFVSANELKSDGRKENQPQSKSAPCINQAWFEPYSKTRSWREPAKEQIREPLRERQIHVEQERPEESRTAVRSDGSDKPSALVRISLQEALELHRPEFVSRSRERMKRLELLVEERRLQAVFNREREELFNCPAPSRPLIPAPVPRKRVVPKREMVQRSKQKYAQLPEVQKRREEERRRAEYSSYRLNAELFNKKVTNRVLGRRAPWQ